MSRFSFRIEADQKVKDFLTERLNGYKHFVICKCSFGFDSGGYFIQVLATPGADFDPKTMFKVYLEYDGDIYAANEGFFVGVSKNKILEIIEKFGLEQEIKKSYPKQYAKLMLDLPI